MPNLEIIKPGMLTSFQDWGRKGFNYFAIPKSGFMDKNAASLAIDILGLPENTAILECTGSAPHIQFNHPTWISITGAEMQWKLNNKTILREQIIKIKKGDILNGGFAKGGFRAYIALHGLFDLDHVFGSQSTYINAGIGGYKGRALQKGDVISWKSMAITPEGSNNRKSVIAKSKIPIYKGPEFDFLSQEAIHYFVTSNFSIGPDSNRMGARLKGPKLESKKYQLNDSLPILPGFIQLPPSGQPIIILQDGQISGGYPRIAYIQEKHLSHLNQIPIGGEVSFEWSGTV